MIQVQKGGTAGIPSRPHGPMARHAEVDVMRPIVSGVLQENDQACR